MVVLSRLRVCFLWCISCSSVRYIDVLLAKKCADCEDVSGF